MLSRKLRTVDLVLSVLFLLGGIFPIPAEVYSDLWGANGERWSSQSRLPDFSYAGYHRGEKSIPNAVQVASVKDFGAVGDGIADDTKAFKDAIAATSSGAIFVPAGRYKITDFIYIKKSNVVLRGAGTDKTVLCFPTPLNDLHPMPTNNSDGRPTTKYSFDFGFLTIQGVIDSQMVATITAEAKRGDRWVQVSTTNGISVGQQVSIVVNEDASQSLKTFLYSNDPGDISKGKDLDTRMVVTVLEISGSRIRFDRPLRFDTRAAWRPQVQTFEPSVTECGIEDLRLDFPDVAYPGEFNEKGYNGIELRGVSNCWIRNVWLHNADLGVNIAGNSCFNTVQGLVQTTYAQRGRPSGHHGMQFKRVQDNLATGFDYRTYFVHDLSVEHCSGNVYSNGKGEDLAFDHHKDTPYENLYVNIDCGAGSRVWRCGGGAGIGRQSAGWETFWNIRAANAFSNPPSGWGPATMNVIGILTTAASVKEPTGRWLETLTPSQLGPADLYTAQLTRRLAPPTTGTLPDKAVILAQMRHVNDYWIANNTDYGTNNWDRSVYYHGNNRLFTIYPDSMYYRYSLDWAEKYAWKTYTSETTRFADDQTCGQAYIELYDIDPQQSKIDPITRNIQITVNSTKRDDWWWIDALYMAMPVYAKLGAHYNDNSYFNAMYELYNDTKVRRSLFNSTTGLWFRDGNFVPPYKEPNGEGCYWSRGNGWVIAAHCRVLDVLPQTDPHRAEYVATFKQMAAALKAVQREDGLWNSSLHDPTHFGGPEASGTCFFTYGMAWGVNNGILDSAEYVPAIVKAWNGLNTVAVHSDGKLGYCQQIGLAPGASTYDETKDYAVGAFMLAGSEVLKLAAGIRPGVRENLAEGKSVTFSGQQAGNEASKAVDGNLVNRWSVDNFPQWIEVDLGAVEPIDAIEVHSYQNRAYKFIVEGKKNASDAYTTIVDHRTASASEGRVSLSFDPTEVRYVKLTVSGCDGYTGTWVSIGEFRVFGSDLTTARYQSLMLKPQGSNFTVAMSKTGGLHIEYTSASDLKSVRFIVRDLSGKEVWCSSQLPVRGGDVTVTLKGGRTGLPATGIYLLQMMTNDAEGRTRIAGVQKVFNLR
jgi:rhamnogalacturonyl hydrolase YesR